LNDCGHPPPEYTAARNVTEPAAAGIERNELNMEAEDHAVRNRFLAAPPRVVNIGLELFATNLAGQGAKVIHVQWMPPAGGNAHLIGLLEKLQG
jgi:hypothetical protein